MSTDNLLTHFIETINNNTPPTPNASVCAELYAQDTFHRCMTIAFPGDPQNSRKEMEGFFEAIGDRHTQWVLVEKSRVLEGRNAVWEGVIQGTNRDRASDFAVPVVFMMQFDDQGLVKTHRVYFDPAHNAPA